MDALAPRKRRGIYGCLHPRKMYNKYLDDNIVVPCGKCAYCQMARSAELSGRVNREMLNPDNGTCLFVTLTYRNADLPVYTLSDKEEDVIENKTVGRFFYSNRECIDPYRYHRINADDVDDYNVPVRWYDDNSFGHLCYEDTHRWFDRVKSTFRYDLVLSKKKTNKVIDYENSKFRYFLCGEYGPVGGRPHYHALLWFKCTLTDEQECYISQVLSKAWKLGNVYIKPVESANVSDYLASYVTSSHNLPKVLQAKSVRPFCTFSKFPTIGTIQVSDDKIREILDHSTFRCNKRDKTTGEYFSDTEFPPSFFRRYFPKCTGFGYKDDSEKLRVYSYVYSYFKAAGIKHSPEEVYNLNLSDIVWPKAFARRSNNRGFDVSIDRMISLPDMPTVFEWDYRDKYASLVCYRYCVLFGYSPGYVFDCFCRLYSAMASDALANLYDQQDEAMHHNTYYVQ